jgi:hypothetical protein
MSETDVLDFVGRAIAEAARDNFCTADTFDGRREEYERRIATAAIEAISAVTHVGDVKSFTGSLNDLAHIVWKGSCPPIGTKLYALPAIGDRE